MKAPIYIPKGKDVHVIAYTIDDMFDPESTLSFILQDSKKEYEPFYWPAFCWPYKVRNSKIEKFFKFGALPNHMDLRSINDISYNLIINNTLCRHRGYSDIGKRSFSYYSYDNSSATKTYEVGNDKTVLYKLIYDSFVGSKMLCPNYQIDVHWVVINGKVIEDPTEQQLTRANTIIGYEHREKILVSVPARSFIKKP
jgi:hypothetical protein